MDTVVNRYLNDRRHRFREYRAADPRTQRHTVPSHRAPEIEADRRHPGGAGEIGQADGTHAFHGDGPDNVVKFKNDLGLKEIEIGVKEFKCIGVSPPDDHPHIYLDMGDDDSILCPYCATRFIYRSHLGLGDTEPEGNLFEE